MATVTQLLDRAAQLTGLRTSGTERTLALQALQNTYRRALLDTECDPTYVSYTFSSSDDSYSLATLLSDTPVRLLHVSLTTSGGELPMSQVSSRELFDMRAVQEAQGTPRLYSTIGFDRIAFYPNPGVGDTVQIWYLADTPTLVETGAGAGEEESPSKIPVHFHWDVLLAGTVLEMLDKDQRSKDVEFWSMRYERGLAKLIEHIGQFGGSANRAYYGISERRPYYRDERTRR